MLLTCGLLLLQAAAPSPPPALAARIHELASGFKGQVSLYARNLDTGASIGLREDERVRTASTIKLAVMVEAFDRVERGELRWDHPLTLTAASQVGGSGILGEFAPGLRLTLQDAMHLMIVISDNTATNLVIDHLSADAVNARMDALGFPQTRLMRKVMGGGDSKAGSDPDLKRYGLGVSTPREMATLLERIERGEVVSKQASAEMIKVLKRQQSHHGIGRTLSDVEIADKTGSLDALRSDVAIVYSKSGRIAMAITIDDMPEVDWTVDNPGLLLMSKLSLSIVEGLGQRQTPPPTPAPTPTPAPAAVTVEDASPKLTPYAAVYFNGFHNSGGTNNQDVPLWAAAGTGDTGATARQSRFGVRASLPPVFGAKTGATIEADFFGGFPAIGTGENFGQVRLRLASMRLDWKKTSLVIGQDWMVFAPVNPASLACAAIPLFAASGNPWARLPQVRLEERFGAGLLQAAVLAPQSGDFNSAFLAQPNSGSLSELPYFQGRLAWTSTNTFGSGKPGAIGVSGHYGQSQVIPTGGTAKDLDSTGGALDWSLPFGKHVLLSGEAFLGENLAGFQAAVFQGYNPDAVTPSTPAGTPESISTKGGWAQLGVTPGTSKLTVLAAYGIDDPDDAELTSATSRNWRTHNEVVALALQYRASAQLSFGLEYRFLETRFLQTGMQKDRHLNLAAVMSF